MKKIISLSILSLLFVAIGCSKKNKDDEIPFDGTLTINNSASLDQALSFGDQVANLTGDLTVTTGGSTGISSALVGQVTELITSVGGNVTISSPDGSVDLSRLTSVAGNYSISGADANDNALTTVEGNILLNYPGGYEMPNLTAAGDIDLTPIETQSSKNGVNNSGLVNFPLVNANSISTVGHRDGMLDFGNANITGIRLGPGIYLDYVVAPFALVVESLYTQALNSLFINAPVAENISIATQSINGDVSVATTGSISLPNVTAVNGNVTISAPTIEANSLTSITGNLTCSTNSVEMTNITTVGGNLQVTGTTDDSTADSANFGNLNNVGGELNIEADEVVQNTGLPHNSGGSTHNSGGN